MNLWIGVVSYTDAAKRWLLGGVMKATYWMAANANRVARTLAKSSTQTAQPLPAKPAAVRNSDGVCMVHVWNCRGTLRKCTVCGATSKVIE